MIDRPEFLQPWLHDGLEPLAPESVVIQLFRDGPSIAIASWTVFDIEGNVRVRRLQAPPGQRVVPREVIGADASLGTANTEQLLRPLRSTAAPDQSEAVLLDGLGYRIRDRSTNHLRDFAWRGHKEPDDLTREFTKLRELFDATLPGYSTFDS